MVLSSSAITGVITLLDGEYETALKLIANGTPLKHECLISHD